MDGASWAAWAAAAVASGAAVVAVIHARSSARQATAAEQQVSIMRSQYATERRDRAEDLRRTEESLAVERKERRAEDSRNAATMLMEPVARLDEIVKWLPRYGGGTFVDASGNVSEVGKARVRECQEALSFAHRSMNTTLLGVKDRELTSRYRKLVLLADQALNAPLEPAASSRATTDVTNYLRYVRLSLRRFIDGEPLPPEEKPPQLTRKGRSAWSPTHTPMAELDV
ncbi:hypothetical protein [Amycolatopsis sp.]|jgi:hypothetical protein|uniref:hypothetical protein n=1 Tax=Amycolatopsis sp. TaxID=37632 RepID=UPI00262F3639|nr:hypothetical protein [Amycolatopsis sp.]